jgi:5-methylthioadenosine/S-adenosylhomocysteine deaminase
LIRGGTTCALTMETVRYTEEVLRVVAESGFRATVGKCMMDKGDDVPPQLREQMRASIDESLALIKNWNGESNGRIRCCFAPRFAISCTRELLAEVSRLAREHGVLIHTHAAENTTECAIVQHESGMRNVAYLDSLGISGTHVVLAHCVHVDSNEIQILVNTKTNVSHCPSSNLKLGSGIAPVAQMLYAGVPVSLGADGAACNNRLDMFTEMRTAALLQKAMHGPEALPAARVLRMATIDGAEAIGLADEIGSIEMGKRGDLIVVDLNRLAATPAPEIVSALVYSSEAADVRASIIDGQIMMRDGELTSLDEASVKEDANREFEMLRQRARL